MGPFRAMMHVISTEGVAGLYRGLYSTLFTLFVANFIYFYAFHLMRMLVRRNKYMRNIGQVRALLAGSLGCLLALKGASLQDTCWHPAHLLTTSVSPACFLPCDLCAPFADASPVRKRMHTRSASRYRARSPTSCWGPSQGRSTSSSCSRSGSPTRA
jgi:hypothetical protein